MCNTLLRHALFGFNMLGSVEQSRLTICRLSNDPLTPALEGAFPGVHVHHGFLAQFQSLTDKATNTSNNITCVRGP